MFVVTCGFMISMKLGKKQMPGHAVCSGGMVVPVREAKARFSSLVARAAAGEEITISWHGKPRMRLVPLQESAPVFHVDRDWLHAMKIQGNGRRSEELIRSDRDGRG